MESKEILQEFQGILYEVLNTHHNISNDLSIQASVTILQELGKYRRAKTLSEARNANNDTDTSNNNSNAATEKQKQALKRFGIDFSNNITKQEASEMITRAIEDSNRTRDTESF